MNESIDKLAELFLKFPGIGPRQAKRFVYFLLGSKPEYISDIIKRLEMARENMGECSACHRLFLNRSKTQCSLCTDPGLDNSLLLVLEKDLDLEAVKRSGSYRGRYFLLGGTVPVIGKADPEALRLNSLRDTVKKHLQNGLKEVILGFSATPAGDWTAMAVKELLEPFRASSGLIITSLGRGLSTGTELEYSDRDTLKSSFENRNES